MLNEASMSGVDDEVRPPALRVISKEELQRRRREIRLENSEVSARKEDIIEAVDKAIRRMQAHLDSL